MSIMDYKKQNLKSYILALVLLPFLIIMIYPFLFMISSTFKTASGVINEGFSLIPKVFTTQAYSIVFSGTSFERYFINTAIVTFIVVAGNVLFAPMAGYAFAKKKFRGKNTMFICLLASMMVPIHITLIPLYKLFMEISWIDSYKVMIIPFLALPMGVFLMRQYIQGLPSAIEQSARIDGCSEMGIYWRIIFPLTKPALAVLIITTFLNIWNSYIWPFIFVQDKNLWTLTVGIANYASYKKNAFNETMVTATIATLPTAIVFLFFQKQIISGLTAGAIKE